MEYATSIFGLCIISAASWLPRPSFMAEQQHINNRMRAILIDYLVDLHRSDCGSRSLFVAVNIIDRFLSRRQVTRDRFQLLGVTATFIACKFVEVDPMSAEWLSRVTAHAYSKQDILEMEVDVLRVLDFGINAITSLHVLEFSGYDGVHAALAQYALELSLFDLGLVRRSPAELALASLLLSDVVLPWEFAGPEHQWLAGSRGLSMLMDCARDLHALLQAAPSHPVQQVQSKFRKPARFAVADLAIPDWDVVWPRLAARLLFPV